MYASKAVTALAIIAAAGPTVAYNTQLYAREDHSISNLGPSPQSSGALALSRLLGGIKREDVMDILARGEVDDSGAFDLSGIFNTVKKVFGFRREEMQMMRRDTTSTGAQAKPHGGHGRKHRGGQHKAHHKVFANGLFRKPTSRLGHKSGNRGNKHQRRAHASRAESLLAREAGGPHDFYPSGSRFHDGHVGFSGRPAAGSISDLD